MENMLNEIKVFKFAVDEDEDIEKQFKIFQNKSKLFCKKFPSNYFEVQNDG